MSFADGLYWERQEAEERQSAEKVKLRTQREAVVEELIKEIKGNAPAMLQLSYLLEIDEKLGI